MSDDLIVVMRTLDTVENSDFLLNSDAELKNDC